MMYCESAWFILSNAAILFIFREHHLQFTECYMSVSGDGQIYPFLRLLNIWLPVENYRKKTFY